MRILRSILEELIDAPLPPTDKIAHELTMKSFEVEEIGDHEGEDFFEIDILPNRAADCLSHIGVAREVAAVFDLKLSEEMSEPMVEETNRNSVDISLEKDVANRFIGVSISGLSNLETPDWMKARLEALGERAIHPIVDVTNYVLLLTGQPLHAYDLDTLEKVSKGSVSIEARKAQEGETLETLDGKNLDLKGGETVIASSNTVLGIAGIKGGKYSGVSEKTDRIFLEAANFDPTAVRKTSQAVGIRTNASKRFENGIVPEMAAVGINEAIDFFKYMSDSVKVDALRDEWAHENDTEKKSISFSAERAASLLGREISEEDAAGALVKVGCVVEKEGGALSVTAPWWRTDITIEEDAIEEVGRLLGYDTIEPQVLEAEKAELPTHVLLKELVRDTLRAHGYAEIITRSFRKRGDVSVLNPMDKTAPFLRTTLANNISEALLHNAEHPELLGLEYIRLFEIGSVFTKEKETEVLAVGFSKTKNARRKIKPADERARITEALTDALGTDISKMLLNEKETQESFILEFDFKAIQESAGEVSWKKSETVFNTFEAFSQFPYVLRDIAVWTPDGTTGAAVENTIQNAASPLLMRADLFDEFSKDGRVSYAFRLVFQSPEKTLTDAEANEEMGAIESALKAQPGFEIR